MAQVASVTDETKNDENQIPIIQSVERAATILSSFTVSRPRLTLNEIAARLGVVKPTAHRYTKALRAANLLRYDEREASYYLAPQILTLAAAARAGLPLINIAGSFLEELVREVNETVVLSVWDGEAPVVVRVDDNADRNVRISVRAGSRLDPLNSAQGRTFFAYLPSDRLPKLVHKELAKSKALGKELETIRRQGLAVNSPAVTGVRTLASPVFQDRQIVASMAVVGTMVTVPEAFDSPTAVALRRMAGRLSEALGSPQPNSERPGA